ncbi:MAG: cell surface protein SprA, partial [Cyclobacteriaceae bacterium]|nr:cell surface protein SprA [Cyclobacteriaceae bacterium]
SIEPSQELKIQLDAKRTNSGDFREIFRFDTLVNGYRSLTPSRSGTYTISTLTVKTAFEKQTNNVSPAFEQFRQNMAVVEQRINSELSQQGIGSRYDSISQDIMMPAFLAAYTGESASSVSLRPFPVIPLPNWRIDYAGLGKIPALAEIFSSINLTHSYRSAYTIGNYTNSLQYTNNLTLDQDILDYPLATNIDSASGKLVPVYIINQATIAEQFAPFIGVNVRTKKNLNGRIDYKKDRNLSLNFSNAQVTETTNNDVAFDFGWVKPDLKLPFKMQGRIITIENDVTFRMNLTIRDSKSIQRSLDGTNKITNGNRNFQMRPSIGYKLNDDMDLTMYFDRSITDPRIGSVRRATTSFGIQLRFNLAQL